MLGEPRKLSITFHSRLREILRRIHAEQLDIVVAVLVLTKMLNNKNYGHFISPSSFKRSVPPLLDLTVFAIRACFIISWAVFLVAETFSEISSALAFIGPIAFRPRWHVLSSF